MKTLLLFLVFLLCLSWTTSLPSLLSDYLKNLPHSPRPHRTELNVHRPPEEEGTAFESDIILSPEQANEIAKEVLIGNRKRRQTVQQVTKIWPNGIIVYRYDDQWPNNQLGTLVKTNVEKSMKLWEDTTCLRFIRQTQNSPRIGIHGVNILFGNKCQSMIGRYAFGFQDLEIAPYCINKIGSLAHEFGHVAGMFHEHSRPDRDSNITVFLDNVKTGNEQFFNKHGTDTERTNEPYDIGSVMHYGPLFFSKDANANKYTLQPHDRRLTAAMGQRAHLSFTDIKTINDLYDCNKNCPRGLQCKHGGYIGPNCACTCPLGLTGRECTQVVHSSSGCGGVLTGSSGKFSSPGYPQKYPISTSCTWLIQGRAGSSISLRFTSLDIEQDVNCFYDHLEVKTYGPTLEGPRYCGNTSPGEIRYNGNALVVKFVSDQQYTNYGFEAQYSIH
ncbi:blastula protease 10-like [Mytilus galloprovincialis]|uniref:blastula protease 10-like n=1 Tax=Mytilus galloprovincialis TaxID=29158 RepID=UPI003F7BA7EA